MASLLAQASRACANTSTRAIFSVAHRAFISSNGVNIGTTRQESSLANAQRSTTTLTSASSPAKLELPRFSTLKGRVSDNTLLAITGTPMKLTQMSPVQAEVFPMLPELSNPYNPEALDGPPRDLLVKAKTGTGKTLAFLVPAVEARLKSIEAYGKKAVRDAGLTKDKDLEARAQRAFARESVGTLIISPTRELATQIADEALRLTHHLGDFQVRLFVGGASKRQQMREWMRGRRDIVVATPGRLRDCLISEPEVARGISKTQLLILDEADTLLDMGFRPDIEAIKEHLPPVPERQSFLFSATVSKNIQQIAQSTLAPNHKFINCVSSDSSPVHAHIPQYYTILPNPSHQIPHILRLLAHDQLINPGASKTILFLPTTKMTQLFTTTIRELRNSLPAGFNTQVYEIHSKRTMEARTSTSSQFRADKSGASVLVTSDVSARGVDYPGVTRVIQIGIPNGTEQYIHRVGRTGRAGTMGRGDLVLLPWELNFVSSQLTTVPLKPLTTSELAHQTKELASTFDADPSSFFSNAPIVPRTPSFNGRPIPSGPALFKGPVAPIIEETDKNVTALLGRFDEQAVRETFMSLLGYYVTKTSEMRITKQDVVDGCRTWAVDSCGLEVPPYVSPQFLAKIGVTSERSPGSGRAQSRDFGLAPRRSRSWEERGSQRSTRNYSRENDDDSSFGGRFADREEGGYRKRPYTSRGDGNFRSGYDSARSGGFRGESKGYSRGSYGGSSSREDRGGFDSYGSRRR